MNKKILLFFLSLSLPFFAHSGGKLEEGFNLAFVSLPHVYYKGIIAATLAKETCSCLFVSELANRGSLDEMTKECASRVSLPLKIVMENGTTVESLKTNRKNHPSRWGGYKVVVNNWGINTPGFDAKIKEGRRERSVPLRILLQRFEAVLDDDPKYGCRLRTTYNFYKSGVGHIEVGFNKGKIGGTPKEGNVTLRKCALTQENKAKECPIIDIIKGGGSGASMKTIYTTKAERDVPSNWPKTLNE